MDTPGADAEEAANKANQAHSISRLIAEMCNVDVPNIGIIFGLGYSGGAIPLAASNLILSFVMACSANQPKGFGNIARRRRRAGSANTSDFAVQTRARQYRHHRLWPGTATTSSSLPSRSYRPARSKSTKQFVADPYILDLPAQPRAVSEAVKRLRAMGSRALLRVEPDRIHERIRRCVWYLRYLGTAGASSDDDKTAIRLSARRTEGRTRAVDRERRQTFLKWLQDPEKVIYDDALAKAWRSYNEKKQAMDDERGRIAQLLFGEPRKNYEDARANLLTSVSMYLYNRWKSEAQGNLKALIHFLRDHADSRQLLRISEIKDPRAFAEALAADRVLGPLFRERFSHEGKKLLNIRGLRDKSDSYLRHQLTAEISLALTDERLSDLIDDALLSTRVKRCWRNDVPTSP
jgi:hypothetical protein